MSAPDQDVVEDGTTDDEVIAAAEALGEELAAAEESVSEFAFTTMVMQCNEAIGNKTGIDFGSVCGSGDCC